jgi:hypothetical protein
MSTRFALFPWLAGPLALRLLASCNTVFTPKYRVLVDAIAAPDLPPPAGGQSYRLLARKSTVTGQQAQVDVIKACVDAALAGKGMFEAPAGVPPDLFIEVGFGVAATPRVDAGSRETFLQLAARANASRGIDKGTGPEVWDVRVAVLGISGRMETAMPLLAAVAAENIGRDTKLETRVEVPQNAPVIGSVREGAIRTLEGGAAPRSPARAGAAVNPVRAD